MSNIRKIAVQTAAAIAVLLFVAFGAVWISIMDVATGEAVPGIDRSEFWIVSLWNGRLAEAVVYITVIVLGISAIAALTWLAWKCAKWCLGVCAHWKVSTDMDRLGVIALVLTIARMNRYLGEIDSD